MLFLKCVKSFLIVSVFLLATSVKSQNFENVLEAVFNQEQSLGLAASISVNENSHNYNFSLYNVARNVPVTNKTQFRTASISKTFTALGILKLYDEGILDLDAAMSTYLGYTVRNPSNNFIKINTTTETAFNKQIFLVTGSEIVRSTNEKNSAINDVSSLQKDVYFLKNSTTKQILLKKIIVA